MLLEEDVVWLVELELDVVCELELDELELLLVVILEELVEEDDVLEELLLEVV